MLRSTNDRYELAIQLLEEASLGQSRVVRPGAPSSFLLLVVRPGALVVSLLLVCLLFDGVIIRREAPPSAFEADRAVSQVRLPRSK